MVVPWFEELQPDIPEDRPAQCQRYYMGVLGFTSGSELCVSQLFGSSRECVVTDTNQKRLHQHRGSGNACMAMLTVWFSDVITVCWS